MKRYIMTSIINGEESTKTFLTRCSAIKKMTKFLTEKELQVDYVIKRDRNHFCEYVCQNGRDRVIIRRVKKGE